MEQRTVFAQKAIGLKEFFEFKFKAPIGVTTPFRAELAAPEGQSTGGGKQSIQPIKLIPVAGGMTLVVGKANQVDKVAEVRTYGYLEKMHAMRSKGAPFALEREPYDAFVAQLQAFLTEKGMTVSVAEEPPEHVSAPPAPAQPLDRASLPTMAGTGSDDVPAGMMRDPRVVWGVVGAVGLVLIAIIVHCARH